MSSFALSSKLVSLDEGESFYQKTLTFLKSKDEGLDLIVLHDALKYHKLYQNFSLQLREQIEVVDQLHFVDFPGHGLSPGSRFLFRGQQSLLNTIEKLSLSSQNRRVIWLAEGMGALALLLLSLKKPQVIKPQDKFILLNPFLYPKNIFPSFIEEKIPSHLSAIKIPKLYWSANLDDYKNDSLVGQQLTLCLWKILWEMFLEIKDYSYFLKNDYFLLLNKSSSHIEGDKVYQFFDNNPSNKNHLIYSSLEKILSETPLIEKVCKDIKNWLD